VVNDYGDIVADNTILRCQVGSGLHGVTTGSDDRDLMGICIEPPEVMLGLHTAAGQHTFEHYIDRWHADGAKIPEGARSGPGDTDLTVYGLSKWAKLAAKGNPTVLLPLWAPEGECEVLHEFGRELRRNAHVFVTQEAGKAFLGYLHSQNLLMQGLRAGKRTGWRHKHTNRPELIEIHGFDTKAAYHALRLGMQGIELMNDGRIELPMVVPQREFLKDIRAGVYSLEYVAAALDELEKLLKEAVERTHFLARPDPAQISRLLIKLYRAWWLW
jgi:predicted nucleotidyltransferase